MAERQFIDIQRRLLNIYENGHTMQPDQLERAIDGITGATLQMVRTRNRVLEVTPAMAPMRTSPQFVDIRLPRPQPQQRPQAELRPRPRTAQPTGPYTAPLRRNPLEKFKTLSRAALEANCADTCAICFDTHKKGESLTTECCHEFGKECYFNWIESENSNRSCPTCRKYFPRVTMYKPRASRINLIVEDNEEDVDYIF
jgi:hypothetical protein